MDTAHIIKQLVAERDRIDGAIKLLSELNGTNAAPAKRGRKPGSRLSPEARAKIAAAQRKRWAKQKKEA